MSRFFPHTPYAEDQPLPHTILATHVLFRSFQSGAGAGLIYGTARPFFQYRQSVSTGQVSASRVVGPVVLRSTGYGALAATALMVPGLVAWMWGKEDIEWSDRTWRLLENEGQKEVDDWSLVGAVVGMVAAARGLSSEKVLRGKLVRMAGGAGAGSLVGIVGYMGWRYGVHGGKRGVDGVV